MYRPHLHCVGYNDTTVCSMTGQINMRICKSLRDDVRRTAGLSINQLEKLEAAKAA